MNVSPTTERHRRDTPVPDWITRLPKVELHLHLDCCLSFAAASRLAPGLSEGEYRERFVAPARCRDFAEWVTRVDPALDLLQTAEGLHVVTQDLFQQLRADNVVYAEIRFAPFLHTRDGLTADDGVRAVADAAREAMRATGVEARLILCTLRHFSPEESRRTAELAARGDELVVALDIAGDEARFPAAPHAEAFALAKDAGLALTAHAGEGAGAQSVREALDLLGPSRIGHGTRSAEDPALVERLASDRIHLESCPGSNVQIGVVPSLASHPIDRLAAAGVSIGISTDARTVADTTLSEEYAGLAAAFGWDEQAFRRHNGDALDAAFIPAELRERLRRQLDSPSLADDSKP